MIPSIAAQQVNAWAAKNTNDLIKSVVDEGTMGNPDLAMLLANALYFKGKWDQEFKKENTKDVEFNTAINSKAVATMHKFSAAIETRNTSINVDGVAVPVTSVKLPYKGKRFSMSIVFANKTNGLNGSSRIQQVNLAVDVLKVYKNTIAQDSFFTSRQPVMVQTYNKFALPKFKIKSSHKSIHQAMVANGLSEMFAKGVLSKMSSDPRAQLSFVMQEDIIKVDEEGTEAAAVTVGGVTTTSVPVTFGQLLINGPFAYAIRDELKGTTMFEGVVQEL